MTRDPKTERREPIRIHLRWKGPHPFSKVRKMDGETDFGIYQVYGPHPASGTDSLLYIGQVNIGEEGSERTFAARFKDLDHQLWKPDHWVDNTKLLRFHTGRVHRMQCEQGRDTIDRKLWKRHIDIAEKLLIYAHAPNWNSGHIREIKYCYDDYHILNWGSRASLLPEVSGIRHAGSEYDQISPNPLKRTASQAG